MFTNDARTEGRSVWVAFHAAAHASAPLGPPPVYADRTAGWFV